MVLLCEINLKLCQEFEGRTLLLLLTDIAC